MAKKKAEPTIIVRFIGESITPANVPIGTVTSALSAVQDLASGRNRFETQHVPRDKSIGLVDVRSGSASYVCVSRAPVEAVTNLKLVGQILSDGDAVDSEGSHLVAAMQPIEDLSKIARANDCRLEVYQSGRRTPMFVIEEGDFARLSNKLFLTGETTIIGNVKRVGGATGMKCLLRVEGRRRILYCELKNREVARRLGQHLYEDIAATGTAVWIHRSWYVYKFTIQDFSQPRLGDTKGSLEELRKAGLDAWDKIAEPEKFIRELRS